MIILWVFKKHESFKALHIFCLWGEYFSTASSNRMGEGRRRQTSSDKPDNNFVCNNFSPIFTFLETDLFVKDQKTLMFSEDHHKAHK